MSTLALPVGARDHAQGPPDAPVTLVEYGDYECPRCRMARQIVKAVQARFGDRLRFVFRHFPLADLHPHAQHAAEAAEAAGGQGAFWPMHERLFDHQRALDDAHLREYAASVRIDGDRFAADLDDHVFAERVREDAMSGVRSGVNGTPTFFVNGARHDGSWDAAQLAATIDAALRERGSRGHP